MGILNGTIDHFVQEVGESFDDFAISRAANGTLGRTRVVSAINWAQRRVHQFLYSRVNVSQLARKVTITEDSENDNRYLLPPRTWGVFAVEDSNGVYYSPRSSRLQHNQAGWIAERRASTQAANNRAVVRFMNFDPTGTISAWVLETPCRMSGGDGTYGAATVTLAADPDLGDTVMDDDYYIGSQFIIVESGSTAFGLIGTATDSVGSTRVVTVPTWSTLPTAADQYSVLCELPESAWPLVWLRATRRIMRVDRRWDDIRNDVREELVTAEIDALLALRKPAKGFDAMPRQADVWVV